MIDSDSLNSTYWHSQVDPGRRAIPSSQRPRRHCRTSLTTLWDLEPPASVLVGGPPARRSRPTATGARGVPVGAASSSRRSLWSSSQVLPGFVESFGFIAVAPGYEADDFLNRGCGDLGGPVLVAPSDRDAYQLVSDRAVTECCVRPSRRGRSSRGSGRPRCARALRRQPPRFPDFPAPARRPIPTAFRPAPGIGRRRPRTSLAQYGSLALTLAEGRFSTIADDLRASTGRSRDDGWGAPPAALGTTTPPDWWAAAPDTHLGM